MKRFFFRLRQMKTKKPQFNPKAENYFQPKKPIALKIFLEYDFKLEHFFLSAPAPSLFIENLFF